MNRRDLLRRAFAIGAGGLLLPVVEPVRRVWALDRTMIQPTPFKSGYVYDKATFGTDLYDGFVSSDVFPLHKGDVIQISIQSSIAYQVGMIFETKAGERVRVTAISADQWIVASDILSADDGSLHSLPRSHYIFSDYAAASWASESR